MYYYHIEHVFDLICITPLSLQATVAVGIMNCLNDNGFGENTKLLLRFGCPSTGVRSMHFLKTEHYVNGFHSVKFGKRPVSVSI